MSNKHIEAILDCMDSANLNQLGFVAENIARKRGKVNNDTTNNSLLVDVHNELIEASDIMAKEKPDEFLMSMTAPSPALGKAFYHYDEEIADVIITCLTLLTWRHVDINKLVKAKMLYNAKRQD